MKGAARSRGGFGRLGRAFSVIRNYGFSSHRLEESLDSFREFLQDNDCPATFACPSALLRRSEDLVGFLKEFDVAIHGMEHIDYRNVTAERIGSDLRQAISDFESVGLNPSGFRAPYLRWNRDMITALARSGLAYDSSSSVFWNVGGRDLASQKEVRKVLDFYSSEYEVDAPSLPRIEDGVVRLPVSLPDDEMLIERLAIARPEELLAYWLEMLKKSYERSELLVLQVHPERFPICEEALGHLLEEVRKRNIWNATLGEVASWWTERNEAVSAEGDVTKNGGLVDKGLWPQDHQSAFCLTGDIDAMSVGDFLRRHLSRKHKRSRRGT
ncbi:MAG: polysaccharide deacetylase family protein [Candidatus Thermoplasmatota archaeon]|nr:polysaccharide deacetylase family protein [Candidatus Thermoplasmatota archaeon]